MSFSVRIALFVVTVVAMVISGCTTRIGDFTLMSTKNVEIGAKYVKTGSFESEDKAFMIIIIPTGIPNIKTCVDRLIENGGGELATNVVLNSTYWWALLVGQSGYEVKGDVWKRASMGDLRDGRDVFELNTTPEGHQYLSSVKNPSLTIDVTTDDDIKKQYDQLVGQH